YADLDADSQVELLRPVAAEGARQLGLEAADLALVSHAYNTTFRLTTPQGEVVAVRVLTNSDSTTAQLAAQHAWMHALARDTAIAVPDPVLGPDGQDHAVVASAEVGRDVVVVAASWLPGDDGHGDRVASVAAHPGPVRTRRPGRSDPHRREEARPHPRRRRLAFPGSRLPRSQPRPGPPGEARVRLRPRRRRRPLPARVRADPPR